MDKTKKLKNIILNKYSSIREFARIAEIPSTTLTSALDKDIGGMAVDRVIKICEILNIDIKTFDPIESNINSMDQQYIEKEEKENAISIKDRKLLNNFNKLNEVGKDEAIKRVSELTLIPSYIEEPEDLSIKTIAAHNDHLTEHGEMDKVMQDIEDMDNW
ncbi:helix-turn-helix domain-containing protein [Paraclostridium bifermentans]|uniref:helix-turn-helix domain-containing protein n=1 Tax=Paraclostridium bifermentans TaxID=1490 RepID=UPI0018ABC640|nr:helix-turn-helix domain-containing protein [Paraclostridium bifermentans]